MICPHLNSTYQTPDKPRLISDFLKQFSENDNQVIIDSDEFQSLNHKERRSILEAVIIEGITPNLINEIKKIDFKKGLRVSEMIGVIKQKMQSYLLNLSNDLSNSDLMSVYQSLSKELVNMPSNEKVSIHKDTNSIIIAGLGRE